MGWGEDRFWGQRPKERSHHHLGPEVDPREAIPGARWSRSMTQTVSGPVESEVRSTRKAHPRGLGSSSGGPPELCATQRDIPCVKPGYVDR